MANVKGKTIPEDLYLVMDKDGKGHFYNQDPMSATDRAAAEVFIDKHLFNFFGEADILNPLVLHIAGVIKHRGVPFEIGMPAKIRRGEMDSHFEDPEGNIIEVLMSKSPDPNFPVNGVVMSRKGELQAQRLYDNDGHCSDGNERHSIFAVEGFSVETIKEIAIERHREAVAEEEKKAEEGEGEEKKPEERKEDKEKAVAEALESDLGIASEEPVIDGEPFNDEEGLDPENFYPNDID